MSTVQIFYMLILTERRSWEIYICVTDFTVWNMFLFVTGIITVVFQVRKSAIRSGNTAVYFLQKAHAYSLTLNQQLETTSVRKV